MDALCIVQSDEKDKDTEIAAMHDIYHHAYLVIAAGRGSDCNDGLLGQQLMGDRCWQTLFKAPRRILFKTTFLYARRSAFETHQDFFGSNPLFQRGWTLQEQWLAPRILHFTPYELAWSCNHGPKCECGAIYPRSAPWTELQLYKMKRFHLGRTESG